MEPPGPPSAQPPRAISLRWGSLPPHWSEVRRALVATLVARTAVNAGSRGPFPFLPVIARGLGVSLETMGLLWGLRTLAGLAAPAMARPAERYGRRAVMLAGLGLLLAACVLFATTPTVWLAATGFLLIGLAKVTYDVPMQAWFGDRVPVHRRGRVLGATELTWSLALLAVVPLSGVLIPILGWQAPFLLTGVLAAAGIVAVLALIRPDRPEHRVRQAWRPTREHLGVLAAGAVFWAAAELLFVVYGAWLEDDLGLSVPAIGAFTLLVFLAEVLGEGGVTLLADRAGLRRSALAGLVVSACAYAALGAVGGSLTLAFAVVFVWFASFEVAIVAMVPLVSVLAGSAPERLLGWFAVSMTVGRTAGAVLGPRLYHAGGIGMTGLVAAGGTLVAAATLAATRPARAAS